GVKSIDPLTAHQRLDGATFRIERLNALAVSTLSFGPEFVGLRKQPARIEGHDVDGKRLAADRMRDGLVLDAKARGEDDPAVRNFAYCGDTLHQIEVKADVRGPRQFVGIRILDSRFGSWRESAADSLLKDFGGVQFLPPVAVNGDD